jgi:hypothetical protein
MAETPAEQRSVDATHLAALEALVKVAEGSLPCRCRSYESHPDGRAGFEPVGMEPGRRHHSACPRAALEGCHPDDRPAEGVAASAARLSRLVRLPVVYEDQKPQARLDLERGLGRFAEAILSEANRRHGHPWEHGPDGLYGAARFTLELVEEYAALFEAGVDPEQADPVSSAAADQVLERIVTEVPARLRGALQAAESPGPAPGEPL